jgi:hypothetical protein
VRIRIKKHIDPFLKAKKLRLNRRDFPYNDYELICQESLRAIAGFADLFAVYRFLIDKDFVQEYIERSNL